MRCLPVALLGVLMAACTIRAPSVSVSPSLSPTASSGIVETDTCLPDLGPVPSALQGDPCPSAITAVHATVRGLGLPIDTIYLEPGLFPCGGPWPGFGSPVVCAMPAMPPIEPGTEMHGWVSFIGSAKVAAVALLRRAPKRLAISAPTPPWQVSLAAFVVPPAGWEIP